MNILIVDGNEKEASDKYVQLGMDTQYDVYYKILQKFITNQFNKCKYFFLIFKFYFYQ